MSNVADWPLPPQSMSWWLASNSKTFRSPFNGATQVARYPGSRWCCSMTWNNLDSEEARGLEAAVAALDGEFGKVRLRSYGRNGRRAAGLPVVNIAGQTGTNLITDGWNPGVLVLKTGDYISVNDELKIIIADVVSNADGSATLRFSPQLRDSPPSGSHIETARPTGIFKLVDNKQGKFRRDRRRGTRSAVTIEFEEAF